MIHGIFTRLLAVSALLALVAPVSAQAPANPTSLGASGDWEAFTYEAEGSKVCYVYSQHLSCQSPHVTVKVLPPVSGLVQTE